MLKKKKKITETKLENRPELWPYFPSMSIMFSRFQRDEENKDTVDNFAHKSKFVTLKELSLRFFFGHATVLCVILVP